jgi:hypothetical protein
MFTANLAGEKYLVRFDSESNHTEFIEQGVYYADELRLCSPSGTVQQVIGANGWACRNRDYFRLDRSPQIRAVPTSGQLVLCELETQDEV